MTSILVTAPVPPAAQSRLDALGEVRISRGDLAHEIQDADVIVVRAETIDADLIHRASRLKVIARTGAGVDNVDVAAATLRGIPVLFAPGAGTRPVAEGTWALILAAAKRLGEFQDYFRPGRWQARYETVGLDLAGSTLGLVGLGSIGRDVGTIGLAFNMTVIGSDSGALTPAELGPIELVEFDELLSRSDVISVHCDLNDSTRGLFDEKAFQRMERCPVFVNAARGEIVDGDDLILEALDRGWIRAAALDVFGQEPQVTAGERPDPRITRTPHAIGLTEAWNERVFDAVVDGVLDCLAGHRPRHLANPDVFAESDRA